MQQSTLLTVIDPTTDDQAALKRAEQLAVDTGAQIHAFCCTYVEDMGEFASRKDAKHQTLIEAKEHLNKLTGPLKTENINVTTEAYWNEDWQESVIHACGRNAADMVIKAVSPHSSIARQLTKTSDFSLLRNASCPVLLTRSGAPWQNRRILAAVDIDSNEPEHDLLNNAIVTEAQKLSKATGFDLYLVAAMTPNADFSAIFNLLEDEAEEGSEIELVAQRFGVNPERIIIQSGSPRKVIIDAANDTNADVLVIGTVARKGLSGAIVGNTAEKLLDELAIDVLTVS